MPPPRVRSRSARQQHGQRRQHKVEHHLGRQAPELGQSGEVPLQPQALHLQQVGDPGGGSGIPGLRHQQQCADQDEKPSRDKSGKSADGIAAGVDRWPINQGASRPRAVEEKSAENEEDRHSDVRARQEAREDVAAGRPGQEADMGQQDTQGCEGTPALQFGQVALGSCPLVAGRISRSGGHGAARTVST